MEKTYECMLEGEEPHAADLMLMFAIFAGAALVWTPRVLEDLNTTKAGAKAAFMAYARTALAILEHPDQLIQPSTTALVAIGTLGHLLMNTDGFPIRVHLLRHRCLLMSREMQIHRLDTAQSREERIIKGCDMIDVEVQRRAWWNMVASDW
jgi:ABC-type multidrug transport system fused ATPase/permease subunit